MEITSFYPLIFTEDLEATKATYEALGFKLAHVISDPFDEYKDTHQFIIMKNDNGLRVCISVNSEQTNIREWPGHTWMNVRDFDEAYAILKEHGFTDCTKVFDLKFMKLISMMAPEGNILTVVYHKREHDED